MLKGKFSTQLMMVLFFGATMLGMSLRTPMWMDEYCFYRLSLGLPDYAMNADIFFEDRPAMLAPNIDWDSRGIDRDKMFRLVYDTPIYSHTPLAPILMWPVVKGLDILADYEIIPHIEEETGYTYQATKDIKEFMKLRAEIITNILRAITITLCCVTLWLIFKIMEKKIGKRGALFFGIPVGACTMMMYGAYLFYWDAFMMFFFVLTLYFMEVKPDSKWKYVTACCLVNTKMFLGIAFLFPLFVKAFIEDYKKSGWVWPIPGYKMALPILSIIPFYIAIVLVTHDPLSVVTRYLAQVPLHDFIYSLNGWKEWVNILTTLGMQFFVPMTVPIVFYIKKYPEYVIFLAMTLVYAWSTGLGITHVSSMVYSGALVFPLVAHEWRLLDKTMKLYRKLKLKSFRFYLNHRTKRAVTE